MSRSTLRRVAGPLLVAVTGMMTTQCNGIKDGGKIPKGPVGDIQIAPAKSWPRDAAGGGLVTVDVTTLPGPMPSWNVPPVTPDTIGLLSNHGEGGKHEKRYDLKPNATATYKLVLSNDGTAKTKWTLYEKVGGSLSSHRSGHLWACDTAYHAPLLRAVGFRDCSLTVTYDSLETALATPLRNIKFASYLMPLLNAPTKAAAIWISCNSGCCSLGV